MKKSLLIGIAFCSSILNAQVASNASAKKTIETTTGISETDYTEVDNYVLGMKKDYTSIKQLSKDLTDSFDTQDKKVRAIFRWMTDNIAYDCKGFHNQALIADKTSEDVIETKKALCGQYARLFYDLCRLSGIDCYIVHGLTSGNKNIVNFFRAIKMFNTDHAWNKVKIDDKWYFVDATWASGGCNRMVTHFYKQFNPTYYTVPENQLYSTHAEEKTESADYNDNIGNRNYPNHKLRRRFLNIFYCTDW